MLPSVANAVKLAKTALSRAGSNSGDVTALAAALAEFETQVEAEFIHKVGDSNIGPLIVLADPIAPMELATKNYVDTRGAGNRIIQFFTSTSVVTVMHNQGKYPSSVRVLIALPASPTVQEEWFTKVTETDLNTTIVTMPANYSGQVILEF